MNEHLKQSIKLGNLDQVKIVCCGISQKILNECLVLATKMDIYT